MKKFDYDMIVIGAGSGGLSASIGAGQLGLKTLLIEKEEKLGGDCLHYGCVPSKSLIKSAYCYHIIKNSQKYGLPKIEAPDVDFKKIAKRIQDIKDTIQEHDSPEPLARNFNVETKFGCPRFINRHSITIAGQAVSSRIFVLATGSSASIPPIEGLKDTPFMTNMDIFTLQKLPDALVILGGGPIAIEMAQAFSRLGSQVTVVELMNQILPKEDADVAALLTDVLKKEGIAVFTGAKAEGVKKEGNIIKVAANIRGEKKVFEGTDLLVATGRRPNVDGLDLEKAGVKYSNKGIFVDSKLRTTIKHIYACGDVIGGYQFTHTASYEAGVIISHAVLHLPFKADYTNVPRCTFTDPEVASVGYNEIEAKRRKIEYRIFKEKFIDIDRAQTESQIQGFIKMLVNKKGKVIGVQIVGQHAGELIHEWVAVLNGKVKLSSIAQAIHIYPTLAEISKKISGSYFAGRLFNNKVRKILKFLFHFQGNEKAPC